jgi:hypothetical protein
LKFMEYARTETDVEAVVAVKRRPNHGTLANRSEAFQQQFPPLRGRGVKRRVVAREPLMRRCHFRLEFGRASVRSPASIFSFSVRVMMPFSLTVQLDRPGELSGSSARCNRGNSRVTAC